MTVNYSAQLDRPTGFFRITGSVVEGGRPMKTRNPDAQRVVERNLLPEPESMQKYSDEVRERIARKPTNSMSNGVDRRSATWTTG